MLNGKSQGDMLKSLREVGNIREKNNKFWMEILALAGMGAPRETADLIDQIVLHDNMVVSEMLSMRDALYRMAEELEAIDALDAD